MGPGPNAALRAAVTARAGAPAVSPPRSSLGKDFEPHQGADLSERATSERRDVAGQSMDGCFTPAPQFEFDQRVGW